MGKVLIVDDEQDIQKILQFILKNANFEYVSAMNGKDAISLMNGDEISLVILDYFLPDMNGQEVSNQLRIINKDLPILFISASDEKLQSIPQMEKTEKLLKPFTQDQLLSVIKKFVT